MVADPVMRTGICSLWGDSCAPQLARHIHWCDHRLTAGHAASPQVLAGIPYASLGESFDVVLPMDYATYHVSTVRSGHLRAHVAADSEEPPA